MLRHPKTTLIGLASALCTAAATFGWLTADQAVAVSGVVTAALAVVASDGGL